MSSSRHPKESQPLLIPSRSASYSSLQNPPSPSPQDSPPFNNVSRADFFWIVSGLWSAVFLGALDGIFSSFCTLALPKTSCSNRHRRSHPRVAHRKLLQQVGTILIPRHVVPPLRLLLHPLIWLATTIIRLALPLTLIRSSIRHFGTEGRNASRLDSIRSVSQILLGTSSS